MSHEYTKVTDNAGRGAVYQAQNPQSVYDPDRNETIVSYRGEDSNPFVARYDHESGKFNGPFRVGTNPLPGTDNHGPPSVCLDDTGHIYLFYGAHNSPIQVVRSVKPGGADEWEHRTPIDTPGGSYPQPVFINGEILVFYRAGSGHGPPYEYPCHEYATISRSDDGGRSWTDAGPVIDTSGHPDRATDAYVMDGDITDGEFRLTWSIAHGEVHDGIRAHTFHGAFDPETERIHGLDGTDFGHTVTWNDMDGSSLQAFRGQHASGPKHVFIHDRTYIITTYLRPSNSLLARVVSTWDDETDDWSTETIPDSLTNHMYSGCYPRGNEDGNLEVYAVIGEGRTTTLSGSHRGGDFAVFTRDDEGWDRHLVFRAEENDGRQISRASTVRNGTDELSALFVEASNDPEDFDLSLFACGDGLNRRQ
jgi:hypothetical protein